MSALYMGKRDYDALDKSSHLANNVENAVNILRNDLAAMYPDNSRTEPTVEDFKIDVDYLEWVTARYISELRNLIAEAK